LTGSPNRMAADRIKALLDADSSWRTDVERLKILASANTPANGFRPGVRLLSEQEWRDLQSYLQRRYVPPETVASQEDK
jgi:hypothetical protein